MKKNHNTRMAPSSGEIPFKRSLYTSGILHAVLLLVMLVQIPWPSSKSKPLTIAGSAPAAVEAPPIQAVVVDAAAIDAAVKRQKDEEAAVKAKQAAEKQRLLAEQQKLRAEKQKLEAERVAEQKRLAQITAEKKAAEQALAAEKKKAETIKKQAEQKALADQKAAAAKQKALADQKAAEAQKLKAAREAALAQAMAAENAQAQAMSAENMREIDRYKAMVQQQIMRNWFVPGGQTQDQSTQLLVKLAPNGTVLDVRMSRSSGSEALDRSAIAAVYKASPLPVPEDPKLFTSFRELRLTLRPDAIISGG